MINFLYLFTLILTILKPYLENYDILIENWELSLLYSFLFIFGIDNMIKNKVRFSFYLIIPTIFIILHPILILTIPDKNYLFNNISKFSGFIIIFSFIRPYIDNFKNKNITIIVVSAVIILVLGIIKTLQFQDFDLLQRFGEYEGNFYSQSTITLHAGFLLLFSYISYYFSNKNLYIFLIILSLIIIYLAFSKTQIISVFITFLIIFNILNKKKKRVSKTINNVFIICIILLVLSYFSKRLNYIYNTENFDTLTGRTFIWSSTLAEILLKPFLGHGFNSIIRIYTTIAKIEINNTHNFLLNFLYQVGFIGTIIFLTSFIKASINIYKRVNYKKDKFDLIIFSYLCIIFINGFGLSSFSEVSSLAYYIFIIALINEFTEVSNDKY